MECSKKTRAALVLTKFNSIIIINFKLKKIKKKSSSFKNKLVDSFTMFFYPGELDSV